MTETEKLILKKLDELSQGLKEINERTSKVEETIGIIQQKVTKLEITLENETNRNIQIIAEGHLNLCRKLDEAIEASHDNDVYKMKVNMLDAEIKKIKQAQ